MAGEPQTAGAERLDALNELVATYESALLRHAARLTGNAAAAEDVVQNAFIKLIRRWKGPLAPSPPLAGWLYRVVHNEAVDHVRHEARRHELYASHARDRATRQAAEVARPPEPSERAAAAAAALARLPERERLLVTLKVYEDKSYREIAEIAGLSVGNVGFILHHAMKKLARILQGEEDNGRDPT